MGRSAPGDSNRGVFGWFKALLGKQKPIETGHPVIARVHSRKKIVAEDAVAAHRVNSSQASLADSRPESPAHRGLVGGPSKLRAQTWVIGASASDACPTCDPQPEDCVIAISGAAPPAAAPSPLPSRRTLNSLVSGPIGKSDCRLQQKPSGGLTAIEPLDPSTAVSLHSFVAPRAATLKRIAIAAAAEGQLSLQPHPHSQPHPRTEWDAASPDPAPLLPRLGSAGSLPRARAQGEAEAGSGTGRGGSDGAPGTPQPRCTYNGAASRAERPWPRPASPGGLSDGGASSGDGVAGRARPLSALRATASFTRGATTGGMAAGGGGPHCRSRLGPGAVPSAGGDDDVRTNVEVREERQESSKQQRHEEESEEEEHGGSGSRRRHRVEETQEESRTQRRSEVRRQEGPGAEPARLRHSSTTETQHEETETSRRQHVEEQEEISSRAPGPSGGSHVSRVSHATHASSHTSRHVRTSTLVTTTSSPAANQFGDACSPPAAAAATGTKAQNSASGATMTASATTTTTHGLERPPQAPPAAPQPPAGCHHQPPANPSGAGMLPRRLGRALTERHLHLVTASEPGRPQPGCDPRSDILERFLTDASDRTELAAPAGAPLQPPPMTPGAASDTAPAGHGDCGPPPHPEWSSHTQTSSHRTHTTRRVVVTSTSTVLVSSSCGAAERHAQGGACEAAQHGCSSWESSPEERQFSSSTFEVASQARGPSPPGVRVERAGRHATATATSAGREAPQPGWRGLAQRPQGCPGVGPDTPAAAMGEFFVGRSALKGADPRRRMDEAAAAAAAAVGQVKTVRIALEPAFSDAAPTIRSGAAPSVPRTSHAGRATADGADPWASSGSRPPLLLPERASGHKSFLPRSGRKSCRTSPSRSGSPGGERDDADELLELLENSSRALAAQARLMRPSRRGHRGTGMGMVLPPGGMHGAMHGVPPPAALNPLLWASHGSGGGGAGAGAGLLASGDLAPPPSRAAAARRVRSNPGDLDLPGWPPQPQPAAEGAVGTDLWG